MPSAMEPGSVQSFHLAEGAAGLTAGPAGKAAGSTGPAGKAAGSTGPAGKAAGSTGPAGKAAGSTGAGTEAGALWPGCTMAMEKCAVLDVLDGV